MGIDDGPSTSKTRVVCQGIARLDLQPLAVVPANYWQAARCLGARSLVSCCVGPGFDFADFALLADLPSQDPPVGAAPTLL